jgi:DNA-binding response OmpR family regulator
MSDSQTKKKLLMVEDDEENQKFLRYFLGKYFQVEICDSSEGCYQLLDKEIADLILMDISIKGSKNGLMLTKELKKSINYSKIPIVCYTAHAYNDDRNNALDAGCDTYISKPTDYYVLLNTLKKLLGMSETDSSSNSQ